MTTSRWFFFEPLKWDEKSERFSGKVNFATGQPVEVTLIPKWKVEIGLFARETEKLFVELKPNLREIYPEMREDYLKLYSESWSECVNGYGQPVGHGRISSDQFNDLVRLESIWFESDESVELCFYDHDELFGGHSIQVWLDQKLNLKSTGLEG
jgi:hypothetical protein